MRIVRLPIATALACLALLAAAGASPARVPAGFIGVNADGPLLDGKVDLDSELGVMRATGVQTARIAVYWSLAQPLAPGSATPPGWASVGGVPTRWTQIDRLMAALGRNRLRILPVVLQSPLWARRTPAQEWSSPTAAARPRYAAFLGALVRRYGPSGTFWRSRPAAQRSPVADWQVWNEPNGRLFWTEPNGVRDYARLLIPAARAVHGASRRARVVLAGLVGRSWLALDELYRRGARRAFDVAAIHPFTQQPANVVKLVAFARRTMARRGDARKPLDLTEVSWTSGRGRLQRTFGYDETERGQAQRLTTAFTRLARDRARYRLGLVSWYTWISADRNRLYPFDFSGLRTPEGRKVRAKPAYAAFRNVVRRLRR